MLTPSIIGITGPFGSGKTTAANFLEDKKGFKRITLSSFLEEALKGEGKEITRKNLQDLANLWRKQKGSGYLAKKALRFASENNIEKIVIDGIRNLGEVEEFKKADDFVLLGIFADRDIRYQRVKDLPTREKLSRKLFDELDYRDLGITEDEETGLQVAKCFAISDYFIDNNTNDGYESKLEGFLNKI